MVARIGFLPYTPKSKTRCPQCGKAKRATLFQNLDTGEIYPHEFSVCDRVQKCGWSNHPGKATIGTPVKFIPEPPRPTDYFDMSEVVARERNTGENQFFIWLESVVGRKAFDSLKNKYRMGTSLRRKGFVSFPQIDTQGRLRQIQEVNYGKDGHRIKTKGSQRWGFEKWEYPERSIRQCYGGSHLIRGNDKPIAVVESFKSAVVASHFIDDYVWVSSTSLGMLNAERCKDFKGRKLILFPDVGAYSQWAKKSKYIKGMKEIKVSDYLELNAERHGLKEGCDIADLLTLNKVKG